MGSGASHVQMWQLDHKEGWTPNNWCFQTVILEKTLESPLGCKEIKPVSPKGNQSQIFIGRTDADTEASSTLVTSCVEPTDWKKTLMLGKIEGWRRRGQQRMRRLDAIIDSMDMSLRKLQEMVKEGKPGVLQSMGSQRVGYDLVTEQ